MNHLGAVDWWIDLMTRLLPILAAIGTGVKLTLQRIDQLSARIDAVVNRIDKQDERLDGIHAGANARMDAINSRVDWFFLTRGVNEKEEHGG